MVFVITYRIVCVLGLKLTFKNPTLSNVNKTGAILYMIKPRLFYYDVISESLKDKLLLKLNCHPSLLY